MSVYIKGFPLPNNCGACPLRLAWCRERIYMVTRPERCPLVPVPEHGRLGDFDELKKVVKGNNWSNPTVPTAVNAIIARMPTIIPASKEGEG